jgi:hypothetical protein
MRDTGPPLEGRERQAGAMPALAGNLREILGLLNPANAMAGDAVYSQEALDRIITSLTEANPQANAAPPASDKALKNLDRREVTKETLGEESSIECSICIDDLKEGDTAVFLPCKHWFHEECVVLWLKEHNTCPICRTPIEARYRDAEGGGRRRDPSSSSEPDLSYPGPFTGRGSGPGVGSPGRGGSDRIDLGNYTFPRPAWRSPWSREAYFEHSSGRGDGSTSPSSTRGPGRRPEQFYRPPSQRQSRSNEALRSVASMQEHRRERERQTDNASASPSGYDTSRFQRRNCLSPTNPRTVAPGEQGARTRQRSPPATSWGRAEQESPRQPGRGPISWLRDRFTGGRPNGNGSSRDGRHD